MNKPKKKYTNLGTIMQAKQDDNRPDEKRFYLKLEQNKDFKTGKVYGEQVFPITLANGKVLNDGDILSLFSIGEKLAKKVEEGKMSQEDADKVSFKKFEVTLVETVNEGDEPQRKSGLPNF